VHLLIELDTFDKGGLQKVVHDTAIRLNSDHFEVVVVSVNGGGYWADKTREHGIQVFSLRDASDMDTYRHILQRERIDLTCSHFSRMGYPLFRELGLPNITFIHNVYAFLPKGAIRQFRQDDAYVDKYISVSPKATRYAVGRFGIDAAKIITVPNGIILDEHRQRLRTCQPLKKEQFGIRETDYLFLNVASYNLHKGHYLMAEAMARIKQQRDDIKLLCIGNVIVDEHVRELKKYIRETGIDDVMLMPGYFNEVESFFEMADAFLLPSFIEGWSIAMNEAMFHGKPMILTDTGGASDVIIDNDIGILIPNEYGDVVNLDSALLDHLAYETKKYTITKKLVEAMCHFADHRQQWAEAGKKGRRKIDALYNFDNVVRVYERIFFSLLHV